MSDALSDVSAHGAQARDDLAEADRGREGVAKSQAQHNRGEISVKPRAPPARERKRIFQMNQTFELIEAQPSTEQSKGVRKKIFAGDCYRRAAKYVLEHEDGARLVHGTIWHRYGPNAGKVIQHAWVDLRDGKVFDGVVQKFFQKESYYRFARAKEKQSFSRNETIKLIIASPTWGPWAKKDEHISRHSEACAAGSRRNRGRFYEPNL